MRLILIILLTFPLIAISCIDKEFQKESEFVQSLIDNPDSVQYLIENSQFYDSTMFYMGKTRDYEYLKLFLKKNRDDRRPEIEICRYAGIYHNNNQFIDSTKSIIVKTGKDNELVFSFKDYNNRSILLQVNFIFR